MNRTLFRQRGAGLIGTLLIMTAFALLGIMALKAIPSYMEYLTIQSTVKRIAHDPLIQSDMDKRAAFDRQTKIDRIESITGRHLVIQGNTISVDYENVVPLYENISLLLKFKVSSED